MPQQPWNLSFSRRGCGLNPGSRHGVLTALTTPSVRSQLGYGCGATTCAALSISLNISSATVTENGTFSYEISLPSAYPPWFDTSVLVAMPANATKAEVGAGSCYLQYVPLFPTRPFSCLYHPSWIVGVSRGCLASAT